jgi:fucose permease
VDASMGMRVSVLLHSPEFWLLGFANFLKVGIGATFSVNLGALVESLSGVRLEEDTDQVLALLGMQLAGRLLFSLVTSPLVGRLTGHANPTLPALLLASLAYCGCFTWAAYGLDADGVLPLSLMFGLFYGVMWTLSATLVPYTPLSRGEDFSLVSSMTLPFGGIGSVVMNEIAGALYDRHAVGTDCSGRECYADTFIFLAACAAVSALCAPAMFYLHRRRTSGRPVLLCST